MIPFAEDDYSPYVFLMIVFLFAFSLVARIKKTTDPKHFHLFWTAALVGAVGVRPIAERISPNFWFVITTASCYAMCLLVYRRCIDLSLPKPLAPGLRSVCTYFNVTTIIVLTIAMLHYQLHPIKPSGSRVEDVKRIGALFLDFALSGIPTGVLYIYLIDMVIRSVLVADELEIVVWENGERMGLFVANNGFFDLQKFKGRFEKKKPDAELPC